MKVIVLCGGAGSRLEDYSLPKPLNMIYGQPALAYVLEKLPAIVTDLYFVVSAHLEKYNFRTIVTNLFKTRHCHFLPLPYFTRGPIESAFVGCADLVCDGEPIVFLDNDLLYSFPPDFFNGPSHTSAFIGYSVDTTGSSAYSFLQLEPGSQRVVAIKEKQRISSNFSIGAYGFATLTQFRSCALDALSSPVGGELYMSLLYDRLIQNGQPVTAVRFPGDVFHVGSLKELRNAVVAGKVQPITPLRICFDLDNTLVTQPAVPGNYATVEPIRLMISLAQRLKAEGHTIIIHTARRMATHGGNSAAALADIGRVTFETLARFQIPYDEIMFGKPLADMYIDDRAVNPYRHDMASLGFIDCLEEEAPLNKLPSNRHNKITLEGGVVVKRGPHEALEGEIYYHSMLPETLRPMFATFLGAEHGLLRTELLKGIPVYTLTKAGLLTHEHIRRVFEFLDILHNTKSTGPQPTVEQVQASYRTKLHARFAVAEDYDFDGAAELQTRVYEMLDAVTSEPPLMSDFIHGDFWFSNLLFSFGDGALKAIDMRGRVGDMLTTGGDRYYDYAKLYQSFLGYDAVLYGDSPMLHEFMTLFEAHVTQRGLNLQHIRRVAFVLMAGTFFAIPTRNARERVGAWLLSLLR